MPTEDPAVAMWQQTMDDYQRNHRHEMCDGCDPHLVAERHLEHLFTRTEGEPPCDCVTCIVREVLNAAYPALLHNLLRDGGAFPEPDVRADLQREWAP